MKDERDRGYTYLGGSFDDEKKDKRVIDRGIDLGAVTRVEWTSNRLLLYDKSDNCILAICEGITRNPTLRSP